MRYWALVLILLGVHSSSVAQDFNVWTEAELLSRNAVRTSELFRTLGPIRSWSSDRYSLRFQGIGLGGSHGSGPVVEIDGLAFPFRFMDRELYENIPISPTDITSISYSPESSVLPSGQFGDGLLKITTSRVKGFSMRGNIGLTNETGDPGPAKYQNSALRNVDRSGPTGSFRFSYGKNDLYMEAGLDTDSYHMTDPLTTRRVWKNFQGTKKPVTSSVSPHIRVAYKTETVDLDVWAGRSLRNDFLFDEIAGWEWPSQQDWKWASAKATVRMSPSTRIGATSLLKILRTNNSLSKIDLPNSILTRDVNGEGFLEWNRPSYRFLWALGGRITDSEQKNGSDIGVGGRGHSRMSINWGQIEGTGTLYVVNTLLSSPVGDGINLDDISFSISAEIKSRNSSGSVVSVATSYRSIFERDVWSTLDHIVNGIQFDEWAGNISWPRYITRERTLDVSLSSIWPFSESVSIKTEVYARQHVGLTLADRLFERDVGAHAFLSDTQFHIGRSGRVVIPGAALLYSPSPSMTMRFGYHYARIISNQDLLFWKRFTGLSPHRITGSIYTTPIERLHFFASFEINSSREWPEYSEYWEGKRPWISNLEGAVSKEMWDDNLRVGISILNMINSPNLTYPGGVIEQLAIRFSIIARFSDAPSLNDNSQ